MQKSQVRRFYNEIWNKNDKNVIPEVLHEHFRFRGSLGQEKRGHEGFADYVDMIHQAIGDYRCSIDFVAEGDKVFAKLTLAEFVEVILWAMGLRTSTLAGTRAHCSHSKRIRHRMFGCWAT